MPDGAGDCPVCGSVPRGSGDGLPPPISAAVRRTPALTARERAVFELLGLGHDNRSIARTLAISERTAKRHVTAILAKLGLESRLQAGLVSIVVTLVGAPETAGRDRRTRHDVVSV